MPTVDKQAIVPYPAKDLYALVNDVQAYPEFLPWCEKCEILDQSDEGMTAKLTIAKSGIRHAFTTQNTLIPEQSVEMNLVDGPFRSLQGVWTFTPLGNGCEVKLHLEFEFASKMLSVSFGPIFKSAASTMLNAFINQARKQYG